MDYIFDGGYHYYAPDNSIRIGNTYADYKPSDEPIAPEAKRTPPKRGDLIDNAGVLTAIMMIDREGETVSDTQLNEYSLDEFQGNYSSKGGRTKWLMS